MSPFGQQGIPEFGNYLELTVINTQGLQTALFCPRELKPRLKSFLTEELQLKCKPALTVSATAEKHLELEPDHGGGNKRKVGKTEEQEENRKSQKKEVKREYFPLSYIKRAKDADRIRAHKLFLNGSAIISTAV